MIKGKALAVTFLILVVSSLVTIHSVSASEGRWTSKASKASDEAVKAVAVNGLIYAIGSTTTEEYDPKTDTWNPKPPMPTPRHFFGIAAYQSKIYCIGGILNNGSYTATNEVYDPTTNSWIAKSPMPTARSQLNAHTVDGKIYLMGGRAGNNHTTVFTNEVYDPVSDSWIEKAPLLYAVDAYASAAINEKIYVIGGQSDFIYGNNVDTTQIYDSQTDSWTLGKPAPAVIWQAGAGATTGVMAPKRIYVMGGMTGFAQGLDQNFAYDVEADAWTNAAPMPAASFNPTVAVIDDLLYVIWDKTTAQYTPIGYGSVAPTLSPSLTPQVTATPTLSPSESPSASPMPSASQQPTRSPERIPSSSTEYVYAIAVVVAIAVIAATALILKRRK